MTGKSRYYVDWESSSTPTIVVVHPGDTDYDYAQPTFSAAKKALVEGLARRIKAQQELLRSARQLRARDVG